MRKRQGHPLWAPLHCAVRSYIKVGLSSSCYLIDDVHNQAGPANEERQPGNPLSAPLTVLLVDFTLIPFLGLVNKLLVLKVADTYFVITFHC